MNSDGSMTLPNFASVALMCLAGIGGLLHQRADAQQPMQYAQPGYDTSVPHVASANGTVLGAPRAITGPSAAACNCGNLTPPQACLGGCQPCMQGFDCANGQCNPKLKWKNMYPVDFGPYGQGEYAGPSRLSHMREYRVRVGDTLQFTYVLSRDMMRSSYRIGIGDQLLIESLADEEVLTRGTFERGLEVQPDGTISVRILGSIHAAGLTIDQLRDQLEEKYKKYYNEPGIDVTPIKTNILLEDIRNAVGGASGLNEQAISRTVTPDGRVALPKIGPVCVQGLTLGEIKQEVNLRYRSMVVGLEVEAGLQEQATHFVSVLGEVAQPGRFEMQGPTTALSAIALAQGHLVGANLRQVVVFRRAEDWRLISTVLDLRGAILGKSPLPADEIWLRDGDVVVVPSSPIRLFDNFVRQVFTEGIYGIVPFSGFSVVDAVNGFALENVVN
ncbi:polysaccharide biosynthesis/export family protein [Rosistilla oblonga]|nr:polysaccharide biosynthesis/export family protein [Rosistilla oblonga]